jgi:hypothetical protein
MIQGGRMKSLRYWPVLLLLFIPTGVSGIAAATIKTVTITNSTAYAMSEFYASPSVNSSWDTTNNLLAGQTVAPGQTTTITIADGVNHCHYDLMAVLYGSAEHAYQYRVDACDGGSWTVH